MSRTQETIKKLVCRPRIIFVELQKVAKAIGIHHNTLRLYITDPDAVEEATVAKIEAWVKKQEKGEKTQ